MHPNPIQEEILRDALGVAGLSMQVTSQRMMGGLGISLKGHLFAHICGEGTGLRLGPEDKAALLATPGAKPLTFSGDPARSAKFVLVPERMLDQLPVFAIWVKKAVKFSTTNTGHTPAAKRAYQKTQQASKK